MGVPTLPFEERARVPSGNHASLGNILSSSSTVWGEEIVQFLRGHIHSGQLKRKAERGQSSGSCLGKDDATAGCVPRQSERAVSVRGSLLSDGSGNGIQTTRRKN